MLKAQSTANNGILQICTNLGLIMSLQKNWHVALPQKCTWETIWDFAHKWKESEANANLSISDLQVISKKSCHLPVHVDQLYLLEELRIQSSPEWVCDTPRTWNQSLTTLAGFPPTLRNIVQRWCGLFGLMAQVKGYFGIREVHEKTAPDPTANQRVLTTIANIPMNFFSTGCFYPTSLSTEV